MECLEPLYVTNSTFTSAFWSELFRLSETSFNFSSTYHPQTDGQTEVVNCTLEMHLRCFTSANSKQWVRWLAWAEFCYNTSWHSTIKQTPFEVVYGWESPSLLTYISGTVKVAVVEQELLQRDQVLQELKQHIKTSQNRMKQVYDWRHREKDYAVGDWVYLWLQPYRQTSSLRKNLKLAPRYYGPFKILRHIGAVAYKLDLPAESKIHPVFHVSLLKEKLGKHTSSQPQLPLVLEANGEVAVRPQAILDQRRRRNQ